MSQLRKDPLVSRWVIVATERARRPASFTESQSTVTDPQTCPFCHDKGTAPLYEHEGVRVIQSGAPILDNAKAFDRRGQGLYDVCHSYGSHEVVVETPKHIPNMADLSVDEIKNVFATYAVRMREHLKDPFVKYVLAYKNYGVAAGSRSIGHSRSQIMAVPVTPIRVKNKISGAKRYYDFHERCLMCDLVRQEIASGERVVAQNQDFVALTPFASRFPFEVCILPKVHHHDFTEGVKGLEASLAQIMKDVLLRFKLGLNDPAYNYMVQTAPFKKLATIKEDYHWHIELMPRLTRVAGFERGTGFYISPIPPEMAAQFLREVQL